MKAYEKMFQIALKRDLRVDHRFVIEAYLNEERERINEVLHEIVSAIHDGAIDTQNCNYLHAMIDEKLIERSDETSKN